MPVHKPSLKPTLVLTRQVLQTQWRLHVPWISPSSSVIHPNDLYSSESKSSNGLVWCLFVVSINVLSFSCLFAFQFHLVKAYESSDMFSFGVFFSIEWLIRGILVFLYKTSGWSYFDQNLYITTYCLFPSTINAGQQFLASGFALPFMVSFSSCHFHEEKISNINNKKNGKPNSCSCNENVSMQLENIN